ncbi:Anaphase-promoting complex subunit 7 [Apostichopus japonicus]|uniref:Anaphase-promoting complex subunit 7 n=1 Tax=Stichopus japonicus TaxID=307972 RepID=A0A2G8KZG7_STIJA|nr:Anaphase-promoting complex subunit 7 [Apostichopus japonicus]
METSTSKQLMRQCQLALDAAMGLFSLGIKGTEVAPLTISSLPNANQLEWLNFWLKGHAYSATKEYAKAVSTFKSLETGSVLRNNTNVLCCLAENYFLAGDYTNAGLVYQRVHSLDPLNITGMDFYAFILHKEKKSVELRSLASEMMSVTDRKPEPWITMGYHALISGPRKACRTVYFANKAHELSYGQIQSLLLKGRALLQMNRTPEATLHFREAVRHAPHRFEAHQGLVDCYIKANRLREAMTTFSNSYHVLGSTPRTLTALASVLAKDRMTLDKAKTYLEKALAEDDSYVEAVYLLANVLTEQDNTRGAIDLLRKHVELQSNSRLHQMLGDLLARTKDLLGASHHYSIAINLDTTNTKAVQGLQRVENSSDSLDVGMDEDGDAVEESSEEAEFDTSDTVGAWTETENHEVFDRLNSPIRYDSDTLRSLQSRRDQPTHNWMHSLPKEMRKRRRGKAGGVKKRQKRCKGKPFLPSIIMGNVRSLNNKIDELQANARYFQEFRDISLMSFTETWLNDNITDESMYIDGFKLLRDRTIYPGIFTCHSSNCLYPNRNVARDAAKDLSTVIQDLEIAHPYAFIVIDGDFNHTNLKKTGVHYYQHVNCPTREEATLDLCYSNVKDAYNAVSILPLGESDHNLVILYPRYRPIVLRQKPAVITVQQWSQESLDQLQSTLDTTDWDMFIRSSSDIDELTDAITGYVNFCVDCSVPTKQVKVYPNNKPWITSTVKSVINRKKGIFGRGTELN